MNNPEIKVGYTVALMGDGALVFDFLGEELGLIELLGLQEFAKMKIQTYIESVGCTGDARVHEVGKAIQKIHLSLNEIHQQLLGNTNECDKVCCSENVKEDGNIDK